MGFRQIGFLGLGSIGEPMAERILDAGRPLTVWNRTAEKTARLASKGATVAKSPKELAAACDVVCMCVTDSGALEEVVFGKGGIVAGAPAPRYLVDHSTVSPEATSEFARRLAAATGAIWIDAPVSGGRAGAQRGELAAFLGGPADAANAIRPIVELFAGNVTYMGRTGSGQAAKACNQVIGFLSIVAVAEASVLAARLGIDPEKLPHAFAGGFAGTPVLTAWGDAMRSGDLSGPPRHVEALRSFLTGSSSWPDYGGAGPKNLIKDLRIIQSLARRSGATLPFVEQMNAIFDLVNLHRPGAAPTPTRGRDQQPRPSSSSGLPRASNNRA